MPPILDLTSLLCDEERLCQKQNYLFDGHIKLYLVPPERAIDIDTALDFSIAELMAEFI